MFFIIRIDPLLRLTSREDTCHTTRSTKINQQTLLDISLGLYTGISHEHLFRKNICSEKRKRIISKKVRIFWDQKQARGSRIITVALSLKLIGCMCLKCHRTFKSIPLQPIKSQRKQYSFNLKIMRTISLCSENTQSRTQASTQATEGKFEGTCYWKSSIVPSNLQ